MPNKNDLKASVIIPAFNAGKTISNALSSLSSQSISAKNFETIVVDDGSTDNTVEIVKKFSDVKIITQKNAGPAIARNNGAKQSQAEIIVFLDSDCIPDKNWLEFMLKPFKSEDVAAVQGAYKSRQKELIARFVQLEIEDRYRRMIKSKNLDWAATYSAAYRKKFFLEKSFSTSFKSASGEDSELSYSLQKKGFKLIFQPKAIVYHLHPSSLFDYLKKKFNHAKWRVLLYKIHPDKAIKDSYTPQTLKLQLASLVFMIVFSFLSLFYSFFYLPFLFSLAIFIIFLIPFSLFALKEDFLVGFASPFILFLRNIVFLFGLAYGFLLILKGDFSE